MCSDWSMLQFLCRVFLASTCCVCFRNYRCRFSLLVSIFAYSFFAPGLLLLAMLDLVESRLLPTGPPYASGSSGQQHQELWPRTNLKSGNKEKANYSKPPLYRIKIHTGVRRSHPCRGHRRILHLTFNTARSIQAFCVSDLGSRFAKRK